MTTIVKKVEQHTFKLVITTQVKEMKAIVPSDIDDCDLEGYARMDSLHEEEKLTTDEAAAIHVEFINNIIAYRDSFYGEDIIEKLPKKKNGTFAKGRVLHAVVSPMGYLSEEEYGHRVDVLRWKVLDDLTAQLELTSYVEKW